jgi:hypothetical protein
VKCSYGTNSYDILGKFVKMKRPADTLMLGDYMQVDSTTGALTRGGGLELIRSPNDSGSFGAGISRASTGPRGTCSGTTRTCSSMEVYVLPVASKSRPRGYPSSYSDAAMNACIKQKIGHLTPVRSGRSQR